MKTIRPNTWRKEGWLPFYSYVADALCLKRTEKAAKISKEEIAILREIRDGLVARTERFMLFLALILIITFFVVIDIVDPPELFSLKKIEREHFIFIGLFVGNIIALLHAGAILKMFIIEEMIVRYTTLIDRRNKDYTMFVNSFFPFSYKVIRRSFGDKLTKSHNVWLHIVHCCTIIAIPILYIAFYIFVLVSGLLILYNSNVPGALLMTSVLILFNLLTLPVHLLTFIPVRDIQGSN